MALTSASCVGEEDSQMSLCVREGMEEGGGGFLLSGSKRQTQFDSCVLDYLKLSVVQERQRANI